MRRNDKLSKPSVRTEKSAAGEITEQASASGTFETCLNVGEVASGDTGTVNRTFLETESASSKIDVSDVMDKMDAVTIDT